MHKVGTNTHQSYKTFIIWRPCHGLTTSTSYAWSASNTRFGNHWDDIRKHNQVTEAFPNIVTLSYHHYALKHDAEPQQFKHNFVTGCQKFSEDNGDRTQSSNILISETRFLNHRVGLLSGNH